MTSRQWQGSRLKLGACLCWLALLVSHSSAATEPRTLDAGYLDFPPFKYTDDQGQAAGPWVTITETLAHEAGFRLNWIELPISRVYRALQQGELDLWPGIAAIPELQPHVLESEATPLVLSLSAFHTADQPGVDSIQALQGQELILIRGFTYLGWLDSLVDDGQTSVSRAPNHDAALQMLQMERGNYLVDYDEPALATQRAADVDAIVQSPLIQVRGSFIVSRYSDEADAIVESLDNAYHTLVDQGEFIPLVLHPSP